MRERIMPQSARSALLGTALLLLPLHLAAQTGTPATRSRIPTPARDNRVLSVKEIVQRESPAIVAIYNLDEKGELRGTGTGFIVRSTGVVVTNYHVIDGASDAMVKLKNGEVYDHVMVIEADPRRDIAVLKIRAINPPTVTLGNSSRVEAGDRAIAIGNPKGLEHTVSDGLVSAHRMDLPGKEGTSIFQISAPISPGSSGGPLYNERGEVIGITTAYLAAEGAQNLNFAVDIKYALLMLDGPANMTLAQLNSKNAKPAEKPPQRQARPGPSNPAPVQPQQPSYPGSSGTPFTDPSGMATVLVEEGWHSKTPDAGWLIELTNGNGIFEIQTRADASDAAAVYRLGADIVKKALEETKPPADILNTRLDDGRQVVAKVHFVKTKDGADVVVFVGGISMARANLLILGFTDPGRNNDLKAVGSMFLSVK